MLRAENVSVRLGRSEVVSGVDLDVASGQVTAVLGPNGSGKTTLLRAISGELRCTGKVLLGDADIRRLKAWQLASRRAVLPQATTLQFPFTVREVVALGATTGRSGVAANRATRLPEEALERVDLGRFGGRLYQELSGGEQQRVQLARVLCQVWEPVLDGLPRFLLLDEPVSSLDIRHQLLIMDIARDYARTGGGVLAILHDLNLAALYADRITVMKHGRVVAAGTPAEVIEERTLAATFDAPVHVGATAAGIPFVLPRTAA